ncbi:Uncharacterized protein APZ42_021126 [Daphnia magna]|uniref:Uncharacterized protein n=1 Tax=Daphnia magna TaxID=35525 RepID=A0A164WZV7_9CRUS|nr:Uncharacterized protein APZ42_021126 [Daphnia magna]
MIRQHCVISCLLVSIDNVIHIYKFTPFFFFYLIVLSPTFSFSFTLIKAPSSSFFFFFN